MEEYIREAPRDGSTKQLVRYYTLLVTSRNINLLNLTITMPRHPISKNDVEFSSANLFSCYLNGEVKFSPGSYFVKLQDF